MSNDKESSRVNVPYLPDDLLVNCLVRVSILYYPTLSLVSKRFRSLIASLELYETRTLLGRTESCLYVCLSFSRGSNPRWFTLYRRPTRILNPNPNPNSRWFTSCFRPYKIVKNRPRKEEKRSSGNLLLSIPTPTRNFWWTRFAIGSNIYMIGDYHNDKLSSRLYFMDCRCHILHEAPRMRIARKNLIVNVLDGIIYVVEGLNDLDSSNLIDFFDPKTQIWELVPSPSEEIRMRALYQTLAIDGKLYLFGTDKIMVYKPKENKWDAVALLEMRLLYKLPKNSCVIDNVLYCCGSSGKLQWCEFEGRSLRDLKGLEDLPRLPKHSTSVKLVDYGGKLAVLWEKKVCAIFSEKKMIWCAEIALERRSGQEIYGKIECCDVVLTVPKSHLPRFAVAVSL